MMLANFFVLETRRAFPHVFLNGKDLIADLEPHQLAFSYKDEAMGKADSVDLDLQDSGRAWLDENFPIKGSKIVATIEVLDWRFPGDRYEHKCGSFTIDSVGFKGPPNTVSVKANSIPTNTKIKSKNTVKAWENTTLRSTAEQIATQNGMTVQWNAGEDPPYKRLEQLDQSDLAFLQSKADENGLCIKITDNKIVFFDEADFETKEPEPNDRLIYDQNVLSWSFNTKMTDVVSEATNSFQNPETGQVTKESFKPPRDNDALRPVTLVGGLADYKISGIEPDSKSSRGDGNGDGDGEDYTLYRYASLQQPFELFDAPINYHENDPAKQKGKDKGSKKAGARRAKNLARKKNKKENTGSFEIIGNPLLCAGKVVYVEGFGRFDGKYLIETATHKIDGSKGYTTDLKVHLTLGF
jgi:uncharacterized protein